MFFPLFFAPFPYDVMVIRWYDGMMIVTNINRVSPSQCWHCWMGLDGTMWQMWSRSHGATCNIISHRARKWLFQQTPPWEGWHHDGAASLPGKTEEHVRSRPLQENLLFSANNLAWASFEEQFSVFASLFAILMMMMMMMTCWASVEEHLRALLSGEAICLQLLSSPQKAASVVAPAKRW